MSSDNRWRSLQGFTRREEASPGVWSINGPDREDHSIHCDFAKHEGIYPCSCDATRTRNSWWWHCHNRWLYQMAWSHSNSPQKPFKWPVEGPDDEPWVPGIDFNDD